MKGAAETAAQIATGGGSKVPTPVRSFEPPRRDELDQVTLDVSGIDKRSLLQRAAVAAHAHDPHIVKVEASLSEEIREVLVITSEGSMVRDSQPLLRFSIRAIAEKNGKRQEGSSGGGGGPRKGGFRGKRPGGDATAAGRHAGTMTDA